MSLPTIIVRHDDLDGLVGTWALTMLHPNSVIFPRQYTASCDSEILHAARGAEVIYVDFSTSRDNLRALCAVAKSVLVLDHHKTARDELLSMPDLPDNLRIAFDMSRSGSTLAFDHVHNPMWRPASETRRSGEVGDMWMENHTLSRDNAPPAFFRYVEDRDLWLWKEPNSREVSAWMSSFPEDLLSCDVMASALETALPDVVDMGEAILRAQKRVVEKHVKRARMLTVAGPNGTTYTVPGVNATTLHSEVGEALNAAYPDAPFSATWADSETGARVWSLRVGTTKTFDASVIAKHHGGGGHAKACGWTDPVAPVA